MPQMHRASTASAVCAPCPCTEPPSIISISCPAPCPCHKPTEHRQHQLLSCQTNVAASAVLVFAQATLHPASSPSALLRFAQAAAAGLAFGPCSKQTKYHQYQLLGFATHPRTCKTSSASAVLLLACTDEHHQPRLFCSLTMPPTHRKSSASAALLLAHATNAPSIVSISCFAPCPSTIAPSIISISCSAPCPCHKGNEHRQHQLFCSLRMPPTHRASSASAGLLSARAPNTLSIISISCSAPCPCHKRNEHRQHQLFCSLRMPPSIISISCSAPRTCHKRTEHHQHQLVCFLPVRQTH